jgi:nitrite reductase/ring-hydroxylating ferredoxin subunit
MSPPVTRRAFLDRLMFTSLAATGVAALAPIPFFLRPPLEPRPPKVTLGTRFSAGVFETFKYGNRNAIALHDGAALRVIDLACTHQGCDVAWKAAANRFECPCHGAAFAADGTPVKGPHGGPLASIPHRVTPTGDLEVGE